MIQTAIQAMDLQGVDGRFHRRVLATQAEEVRALALALGSDSLPFFGITTCGIRAASAV